MTLKRAVLHVARQMVALIANESLLFMVAYTTSTAQFAFGPYLVMMAEGTSIAQPAYRL